MLPLGTLIHCGHCSCPQMGATSPDVDFFWVVSGLARSSRLAPFNDRPRPALQVSNLAAGSPDAISCGGGTARLACAPQTPALFQKVSPPSPIWGGQHLL